MQNAYKNKKDPNQTQVIKITMYEIKNTLYEINGKLYPEEEKNNKLEDIPNNNKLEDWKVFIRNTE